ncbi:MAG: hypothetical protein R3B95_04000 [Nitrospirales bacterium]|nr:hypothetical protein [Nitrospirales bacterium]
MGYHEMCFLLIVHHSVDSVLLVKLQLATNKSIPNNAFGLAPGRMLLSTGSPCPSAASWAALLSLASALCDVARRASIWMVRLGERDRCLVLLPEQKWLGCQAEPRQHLYVLNMPESRMIGRTCLKILQSLKVE